MQIQNTFLLLLSTFIIFGLHAQDIDEIIAAQQIDTLLYNGPKDNRINWAIQNRGVNNPNQDFMNKEAFIQDLRASLLRTFDREDSLAKQPYAQYNDFFNLYGFWWPDALSEAEGWNFNIIKQIRDSFFLPWATEDRGWASFFSTTKYGGGGGAGLVRERRVGDAKVYGMGWETFLHEFGHTMPGLLDEYSASGEWSGGQCWETPNTTGQMNREDIPWRKWIDPSTPIPTPYTEAYLNTYGAFEGALTNFFGCHRPSARSCFMGAGGFGEDYGQSLCNPCIQRVICYLYRYVNVIENPSPADPHIQINGQDTLTFSADILHPNPNTQQWQWSLNGRVIAMNVDSVEVAFGVCDSYELKLSVLDTNHLVRYDPKFDDIYPLPYQEYVWTIDQGTVNTYDLTVESNPTASDCSPLDNGSVAFQIDGGLPPYEIWQNGEQLMEPPSQLAAGTYEVQIVDARGCGQSVPFEIMQEPLLEVDLCATYDGNAWQVLASASYAKDSLDFNWSNNAQGPLLTGLSDGVYEITVTTQSGCSVMQSIALESPNSPLSVRHTYFHSKRESPSGRIYIHPEAGRPPYTVEWKDLPDRDFSGDARQAIASDHSFGHLPEFAFDDQLNTKWLHNISSGAWIGVELTKAAELHAYAITSANDVPERDPKDWQLQASMDGQNWEVLHTVRDFNFQSRYERQLFLPDTTGLYTYYRLYVEANHGNSATQLQELELIGQDGNRDFEVNEEVAGQFQRSTLAAGRYIYILKDANQSLKTDTLHIELKESVIQARPSVVKWSDCELSVDSPKVEHEYMWFADKAGTQLLAEGTLFQAERSGNYYLGVVDQTTGILSEPLQGFAVSVTPQPQIEESDSGFHVIEPDSGMVYRWYASEDCSALLHEGLDFIPSSEGAYFAAAYQPADQAEPIEPRDIPGLVVRMDAADLDGDGKRDLPAPPNSSVLDWVFTNGNRWADGSWFAYRSNYQNGLGVADFGTIWLQRIRDQEGPYQTYMMAYEENPLSFEGRAPFESLSAHFPKAADSTQLYADQSPMTTLQGSTYLNGKKVNPLNTANPMDFCILGSVATEPINYPVVYTDTHWEGKLGELILYDRALTEEEMKGLSSYLHHKWILTAQLESPKVPLEWKQSTSTKASEWAKWKVYPNPASELIHITAVEGAYDLRIVDALGRIQLERKGLHGPSQWNVGHWETGWYIVQIKERDQSRVKAVRLLIE